VAVSLRYRLQHPDALGGDLSTDPVPWQYDDPGFHRFSGSGQGNAPA
jgi:hypothetical protein